MSRKFRTQDTHDAYEADKRAGGLMHGCRFCEASTIYDFTYWRVIPNKYPYDAVADEHTMLVPKRHAVERQLTDEERAELLVIKGSAYAERFTYLLESLHSKTSVMQHYHLHFIKAKDEV
jgi:diadenosine tetraphosphate (Ap4A) HIT family hydrolase